MSGIHYVAKLERVREVTLAGVADLAYWSDVLRPEGLAPEERSGNAELRIIGVDARFHGVRFQELSMSVVVAPQGAHDTLDRAFLMEAFNSRRLFAWSERVLFSTPYSRAEVDVTASPAALRLSRKGETMFEALKTAQSDPIGAAPDFEGTVFIPSGSHRRFFFARLEGVAHRYPFSGADMFSLEPGSASIMRQLAKSNFEPREWIVRADAFHARSRTYRQSWPAATR